MNNSLFVIERARAEDAVALLDYLKIVGGETENLSFGAEGVPFSLEAEQDYLRSQCESADNVQYLAKMDGEIIGTASLNRKPRRMSHRGEFGISLKKAWWGCGAASALMEAIPTNSQADERSSSPAALLCPFYSAAHCEIFFIWVLTFCLQTPFLNYGNYRPFLSDILMTVLFCR